MKILLYILIPVLILQDLYAQNDGINKLSSSFKIVRLKYSGGGDWYNDPSAEVNMMDYLKKNTVIDVDESKFYSVDLSSDDIFNYPFILITGHGNITFSDSEVKRLRQYLERGGFLYADDDYGMDKSFRREIEKVFPDQKMQELPFDHKILQLAFQLSKRFAKNT